MNPELENLHTYPFEKLRNLLSKCNVNTKKSAITLAIGEPKHKTPKFITKELEANISNISTYPTTRGTNELKTAIINWLCRRFNLSQETLNEERNILPTNGTREALFSITQTVVNKTNGNPIVMMPNPFYQIYEGAALLAGAEPYYLNCIEENKYIPDLSLVPKEIWQRCQLFYLCSPGNPSGAVVDFDFIKELMMLADKYNFIIASDECYSEIYYNEEQPPLSLLEYAKKLGNFEYKRCLIFHSLSKRSNVPGLRSGFVAGDSEIIEIFYRYRTYHGCAMPLHVQKASIAAWNDEKHVKKNRDIYREKFLKVCVELKSVLPVTPPSGGFYLWPKLHCSDEDFAKELYTSENVEVLPGSYLSRNVNCINPGDKRVRIALVAETDLCIEAAKRIKRFIENTH
jgi:N-succinyldiaminopimelate aminotransferase